MASSDMLRRSDSADLRIAIRCHKEVAPGIEFICGGDDTERARASSPSETRDGQSALRAGGRIRKDERNRGAEFARLVPS